MDPGNERKSSGWNDPPPSLFTNQKRGAKMLNYERRIPDQCINEGSPQSISAKHAYKLTNELHINGHRDQYTRHAYSQSAPAKPLNANAVDQTMQRVHHHVWLNQIFDGPDSPQMKSYFYDMRCFLLSDNTSSCNFILNEFINKIEAFSYEEAKPFLEQMMGWNKPWINVFIQISACQQKSQLYNAASLQ
ncbi:hypothetical protein RF11_12755 [Thelohanellus kitauei]|uniref:Uncharacterized protein n=1 Tax=Thelohanellus kitauei TaxID=669202 RepID=A0A0C2MI59_THEKT|nr:hypothetical protein RF11_12755 [Thelohanellus kitauei]